MKIDQYTELYGIIGYPVRHSLSPLMHNTAFEAVGINAVYLAFETRDLKAVTEGMKALPIKGMSVTTPHKIRIIDHLDDLHALASQIGSVNTVVNHDGRLIGFNTDASGALRALEGKVRLEDTHSLIVGAGGAARSIAFALKEMGAIVTITNRTASKGKALTKALGCGFVPWEKMDHIEAELIVQTTPLGMAPDINACPIPVSILKPGITVMDIIYNPRCTRLLRLAESRGCQVIDGVSMFVHQGAEQFRIWTNLDPPLRVMEEVVKEALEKQDGSK